MIEEEKPAAAFILSLVGLIVQGTAALIFAYGAFYVWNYSAFGFPGPWMMFGAPWYGLFWGPIFALFVAVVMALGTLGVIWINDNKVSSVRAGSVLVLIASIIAFPTMFGFMIGSLLMFIGGILGLVWQPKSGEKIRRKESATALP